MAGINRRYLLATFSRSRTGTSMPIASPWQSFVALPAAARSFIIMS